MKATGTKISILESAVLAAEKALKHAEEQQAEREKECMRAVAAFDKSGEDVVEAQAKLAQAQAALETAELERASEQTAAARMIIGLSLRLDSADNVCAYAMSACHASLQWSTHGSICSVSDSLRK